jgi:hypothetical protein
MKTALLGVAFVAVALPAHAASLQDQVACAKLAEKAAEGWNMQSREWLAPGAESHYNDKLHLCIALITIPGTTGYYDEKHQFQKNYPKTIKALVDAVSGHEFGLYMWDNRDHKKYWEVDPWNCRLEATPYATPTLCKTKEDFEEAVRPFMAE